MSTIIRSLFILMLTSSSFYSLAAIPNSFDNNNLPSLAPLIKKVSPAVVDITVSSSAKVANNILDLLGPNLPPQSFSGLGSGVIIDAENGYIITNYHVIKGADDITIGLTSGHKFKAKLIGEDPKSDIALLQIKSDQPLIEIKFANSDELQVGDFTIAIGNPFGLGQTVTSGIVSALGRSGLNLQNLENYIQTDAAINSGNSGGALLNLKGELIGINTAILGPNGGNIGIAFAIPSNMVKNLSAQFLEFGEVRRGILGIRGGEVTPELAKSFGLEITYGAFIFQVTPDSAAEKAGLDAGDVITAINGTPIKSFAALRAKIGTLSPGKKVSLSVLRENKQQKIYAVLGGEQEQVASINQTPTSLDGAMLQNIVNGNLQGVKIVSIKTGSIAEHSGLLKDDIIIGVNKTRITNIKQLNMTLKKNKEMKVLNIMRNNRAIYIVLN